MLVCLGFSKRVKRPISWRALSVLYTSSTYYPHPTRHHIPPFFVTTVQTLHDFFSLSWNFFYSSVSLEWSLSIWMNQVKNDVCFKTITENWVSKNKAYFFRNQTFLFYKIESWNVQHLFKKYFRETSHFNSIKQPIEEMEKTIVWMSWKSLWGCTKFFSNRCRKF
jgi:hypothetical protein